MSIGNTDNIDNKNIRKVEHLLRTYKFNVSRVDVLRRRQISDKDKILKGLDTSNEYVQTSNLSSLDNIVIAREEEIEKLERDIQDTESMLDSMCEKDNFLITQFYIEKKTAVKISSAMGYSELKSFWRNKKRILEELSLIIEA